MGEGMLMLRLIGDLDAGLKPNRILVSLVFPCSREKAYLFLCFLFCFFVTSSLVLTLVLTKG